MEGIYIFVMLNIYIFSSNKYTITVDFKVRLSGFLELLVTVFVVIMCFGSYDSHFRTPTLARNLYQVPFSLPSRAVKYDSYVRLQVGHFCCFCNPGSRSTSARESDEGPIVGMVIRIPFFRFIE